MKKIITSLVIAIMLISSLSVSASTYTTFTDVNESDYFYVEVEVASERGFINGIGNNQFDPYSDLTIAQAIKLSACINAVFYENDIKPYDNMEHWADAYYDYAVQNGIIEENDFSRADFDNAITRDRLFYIFANTLPDSEYIVINETELASEKPEADYVEKLFCAGIIIENENGFELENTITRADSSIVVSRLTTYSRRQFVMETE